MQLKGGKPLTKANEATYFPAKDYRVFFEVIPQVFTTVFFKKVKNIDILQKKKNGPVNFRPLL